MIKKPEYQAVIGLEIHIELKTAAKMFCSCSAKYFGHKPNTHCCPVCLGLPGALPVANKKAISWTVMAGMALRCQIPFFSKFDRKNYFYPDLPKGYQISQYDLPLGKDGQLEDVRLKRVHLEEDTAKLIHDIVSGEKCTLIDFNRSGVPLMEVVTEPDIKSPQQAKEFLKKLAQVVRYLGISDCDMEKGSMRLEANVSLKGPLETRSGNLPNYKVEIKNLNSFRFVEKAIAYEIKRQDEILRKGSAVQQETRGWNESSKMTYSQRFKEEAQDYRYFPEPDLPPIIWRKSEIEALKKLLPELPSQKFNRFKKDYGLSEYNARILTETRPRADYFEQVVKLGKKQKLEPAQIANTIINKKIDVVKTPVKVLIGDLVKKTSLATIPLTDLEKIAAAVLKNNPRAVEDYKKGKINVVEFLLGQILAQTKGRANPNQVRKVALKLLNHG